ncbi:MAG: O-methyltransferase [Eubacteriales bacterium]|nr:O-methyltransferase [Eubacteriales bacterium]
MICDDRVNEILGKLEKYAAENKVPIVMPETANLLLVLGRLAKPKKILEIGTAIGYSTILLASVLEENGRIDTVDRSEEMIRLAKENILLAGCSDKVNIILGEALDVLKCLDGTYDMIFMDAAKGQYIEFLADCLRLLKKGGLMVTDNVLYRGLVADDADVPKGDRTIVTKLRKYLASLCSNEGLDTAILPVGDGVAVTYKRGGI